MPIQDREKRNETYRRIYREKYKDPAFREAEAERKRKWYNRNLEKNQERVRNQVARFREKKKRGEKLVGETPVAKGDC